MIIKNEADLKKVLNEILIEVIDSVSVKVRENLQEFIKEEVYFKDYYPNKVYENGDGSPGSGEASWEFYESFRWKGIKKTPQQISNELFNSWQSMTIDRLTGRHYDGGKDIRKELVDLLNTNGIFGGKRRGAYWDNFIKDLDASIDSLYLKALREAGLNVV